MPRLKGGADLLEDRRRRALALLKTGLSFNEVGRRIQCAASSVMRWFNAWRRGGAKALKVRSSPGRPVKLKPAEQRRLVRMLLKGPLARGYRANLWTTARIAEVIEELMKDLINSIDRIQRSPAKLRGCILQSELPPFLR